MMIQVKVLLPVLRSAMGAAHGLVAASSRYADVTVLLWEFLRADARRGAEDLHSFDLMLSADRMRAERECSTTGAVDKRATIVR